MKIIGKNKDIKQEVEMDLENSSIRPMAITVKIVLLNAKKEVLLLKRSKKCLNPKKWDLPGGHIDAGETIEEAVKREAKEETGLEVEMGAVIDIVEFPKEHEAFKSEKRGLRYIAHTKEEEVILNESEHLESKWLPLEEAVGMLESSGFEGEKRMTIVNAKKLLDSQEAEERWKRTLADFDNFKRRTEKNNEEFKKFCLENFIMELLPVIDNFEMATEHIPEDQQELGWVVGIMHIKNQLSGVLEGNGVSEIPTILGDNINEKIHEVLKSEEKDESGEGKARVKKILKKGYQIGERVIRPATVESEWA